MSNPAVPAEGLPDDGLDVTFYRASNADLALLSDEALRDHYRDLGHAEGRQPRADADRPDTGVSDASLPSDFDPAEYGRLNPDLALMSDEALRDHYRDHGRAEGRQHRVDADRPDPGVSDASLPPDFDPAEYGRLNPDLALMSDEALKAHYRDHGHAEGRQDRADADRPDTGAVDGALPPDFDPAEYGRLNPDVPLLSGEASRAHYRDYGRAEGRAYTELDPRFYGSMYLADEPYNLTRVMAHFAVHGQEAGVFRCEREMLKAHGMPDGAWLKVFSERAFVLFNAHWAPSKLTRPQALELFLSQGLARLAQMSFSRPFDVAFYRELQPHLTGLPDAMAYRYWLSEGLKRNEGGTPATWLRNAGLQLGEYPRAFAWRAYAISHMADQAAPTRWQALVHLIHTVEVPVATWPLLDDGAGAFLEEMGTCRMRQGRPDLAIACYDRAKRHGGHSAMLEHLAGDALRSAGQWAAALSHYDAFHAHGGQTLRSVVLHADCAIKLALFDQAREILRRGKAERGEARPWLDTVRGLMDSFFADRSTQARALYGLDDPEARRSADAIMTAAVDWVVEGWLSLLDQPVPIGPSSAGPVLILATSSLKQCTHYRVEQKIELLEKLGRSYRVFDHSEVDGFLAALPGASAAIFYRVPALPSIVRAIVAANSQKIPTFYEIDDLIFDSQNYPDTFESFQGQIDQGVYQGLLYGTPLYRAAMALCDFGIASTPTLVCAMEDVVRKGEVALLRNGLDSRSLGVDTLPTTPNRDPAAIRIAYGSATLAHNQDFHDLAGPGLCAVLAENPRLELLVIGHLALGPMFDPYLDRIVQAPLMPDPATYWSLLATADINLAVVAPGTFSDGKSEIKWLEAALLGIPSIVSATATYREIIEDRVTGLLAATEADWTLALRELVSSPSLRDTVAKNARAQALRDYSLYAGANALKSALVLAAPPKRSRKRRVLIVNVYFPPQAIGGATRVVSGNLDDWIAAQATDDFEFAVATTDFDASSAYCRLIDSYRGIPVFRIAPPLENDLDWKATDPEMGTWFAEVLAQFEPDLVHFHCVQRLTTSVLDACREADIPYVVTAHDGWWLSDYQFLFDETGRQRFAGDELALGGRPDLPLPATLQRLAQMRRSLEGARAVLAPSETFAELYRQAGFGSAQAVSNGLPDLDVRPKVPATTARVRLGHIGDTSAHKGFDLVEAALKAGDFPNLELLALSHAKAPGSSREDTWGTTPVRISGRVPQDQIHEIYARLDVLLAPSSCVESYGLVTREANAFGVWVVASDRGGIGEDVRHDVDGFVIDVSDIEGLSAVLSTINADPERFRAPAPVRTDQRKARDQAEDLLRLYRRLVVRSPVRLALPRSGRPSP